MSFGSVALGLASLVLGVHHLKKSADHLSGAGGSARQRQLAGLEAAIQRQNSGKQRRSTRSQRSTAILSSSAMPGRAFHDSGRHMVGASNGAQVAMQMRSFNIKTLDDRIGYLRKLVDEGKRDPRVYAFARQAVSQKCGKDWCVDEKNNLGEAKLLHRAMRKGVPPRMTARDLATAKTLFKNIRKNVRYTSDIRGVDTYQKPGNTLSLRTADCLPAGTQLLKADGTLISIENAQIGDVIFDGSGWTKITNWWDKGVQDVRALKLDNGSTLRCTDGHKLFRIPLRSGTASSAEEVRADEVRLGEYLLQPREMAFADEAALSEDEAFLLGAYLAEGHTRRRGPDGEVRCVEIAGIPDSKGVRERAIAVGARLGLHVTELERMVYLTDRAKTGVLQRLLGDCGGLSYTKHLPHTRWSKETVGHILSGLDADGGVATNGTNFVFSTTSPELAVQYRILQRVLGKSTSIKRVDDHGGLGTHPIYRVTVRSGDKNRPWAKVKALSEGGEAHVYDIETDSHRFYIPEQDIVVHNCDDYSTTACSALESLGIPCAFKVIRTKGASDWNHIYALAGFPRANPTKWIPFDASVNMPFGWEAPSKMVAASRIFPLR